MYPPPLTSNVTFSGPHSHHHRVAIKAVSHHAPHSGMVSAPASRATELALGNPAPCHARSTFSQADTRTHYSYEQTV